MAFGNKGNYYRPSMFGGFSFFPPVIKTLLIINVAVFIITGFFGRLFYFGDSGTGLDQFITKYFALWPIQTGYFWFWQLLSYQFLHADIWHIFFNMFFGLWMFGMEIEHLWGSRKFLTYYLTCGVVAGLSQLFLAPILEPASAFSPVIGASGAVYGVLVAFAMMFPDRYLYIYFLIPVKAKYFIMFLIALGVLSVGGASNVANLAHLGGAFAGFVYILIDRRRLSSASFTNRMRNWARSMQGPKPQSYEQETPVYDIHEAKVTDVPPKKTSEPPVTQERIDEILDKIGRSGYKALNDEEKRILFEASKKLN